jgi:hypothetical protein
MQRCPKCGYRDRMDVPWILSALAFLLLYSASVFAVDHAPMIYRIMALAAFVLFVAGGAWRGFRNKKDKKDHDEYLKLNSITERVKAHIRPTPSQ